MWWLISTPTRRAHVAAAPLPALDDATEDARARVAAPPESSPQPADCADPPGPPPPPSPSSTRVTCHPQRRATPQRRLRAQPTEHQPTAILPLLAPGCYNTYCPHSPHRHPPAQRNGNGRPARGWLAGWLARHEARETSQPRACTLAALRSASATLACLFSSAYDSAVEPS